MAVWSRPDVAGIGRTFSVDTGTRNKTILRITVDGTVYELQLNPVDAVSLAKFIRDQFPGVVGA